MFGSGELEALSAGGTYILLVEVGTRTSIDVGKLGPLEFDKGTYAYVGSAHGPGGLRARLGRYFVGPNRKHWHIDYLLEFADAKGALGRVEQRCLECEWARWLEARGHVHLPRFGASDCRCASHLFFVGDAEEMEQMIRDAGCELKATHFSEGDHGLRQKSRRPDH